MRSVKHAWCSVPLTDSMVITQGCLKPSGAVATFTPTQMWKPEKTMGLSTRCSISSCETYLWLLAARRRVTFPSHVTAVSSLLLHPVAERTFISRQSLPQHLLIHLFSFTVGVILIVPWRKWELTNEANRGTPNSVTKMSNNKKRGQNKSDPRSTKTTLYLSSCTGTEKSSIVLYSCHASDLDLTRLLFLPKMFA